MNYLVRSGKEDAFTTAFRKVVDVMREMEGHRETRLYSELDNPRAFLIVSEWDDRKAFDAFIRSPRFASVVNWGKEEILEGRPRHEIYEKEEKGKKPEIVEL